MFASLRPMVISSRTTGTTVLRPSSSSMISFMESLSKVRAKAYQNPRLAISVKARGLKCSATPRVSPSLRCVDECVDLRAVVGAVRLVLLEVFLRARPVAQVRVAVAEAAIGLAQRRLVGRVLRQGSLAGFDGAVEVAAAE